MMIFPTLYIFFVIAIAWTIVWKGYALWLAARRGDRKWFVAILIVNTLGILEIVYIFHIAKQTRRDIAQLFRKESRS